MTETRLLPPPELPARPEAKFFADSCAKLGTESVADFGNEFGAESVPRADGGRQGTRRRTHRRLQMGSESLKDLEGAKLVLP